MPEIVGTVSNVLIQLPMLLAWLVGVVLSLFNWRRQPRISLLTLSAIALLFVELIVSTYLNLWLPITLSNKGWNMGQLSLLLPVIGAGESLVRAVAWGLLLAAIFGWRSAQ